MKEKEIVTKKLDALYKDRAVLQDHIYLWMTGKVDGDVVEIGEQLALLNAHVAYWETLAGTYQENSLDPYVETINDIDGMTVVEW